MFKLVTLISVKEISSNRKVVYLTFDDGPEPEITEYVIETLNKYKAKATFFCTGKNYNEYPELVELIKYNEHVFGNHTYSHVDGLKEDFKTYMNEVDNTREIIQTKLFRPPWGALSIRKLLKLRKENKIIMWSITSNDTTPNICWVTQSKKMVRQTKPGSIILFHCCTKHAKGTKEILSIYVEKLLKLGYSFDSIDTNFLD